MAVAKLACDILAGHTLIVISCQGPHGSPDGSELSSQREGKSFCSSAPEQMIGLFGLELD